MKKILIIPDIDNPQESLDLAAQYSLGFEYNDFFRPDVLDNPGKVDTLCDTYNSYILPEYCTIHGAFFDVIPFSLDSKIREISLLRINQSIEAARKINAKAVVFHTNYNPFLNAPAYVEGWIRDNVQIWSQILEENPDLNIYLENMFDETPDIMVKLSEQLCSYENYGVCLDYAHAALSKEEPKNWAKALGPYVKHIHINDNDLVSDLHLAWGEGRLDRQDFYDAYEKYMSEATVLIEVSTAERKLKSIETLIEDGFIN